MILQGRYRIDMERNRVIDITGKQEHKLEPRVMKVLEQLAANAGKVVTREELTEKIWDNYGGAEDALTQAISVLRKVFNDNSRELIVTVPKKGYVLEAAVSHPGATPAAQVTERKPAPAARYISAIAVFLLLAIAVAKFVRQPSDTPAVPATAEPQADSATIQKERAAGADSNHLQHDR